MIDPLAKTFRAAVVGGIIFLGAYVIEIGVDVWIVNREAETAAPFPNCPLYPPTTHIRHYVLPLGGLALATALLFRRAAPAGRDALWTLEVGGPIREAFRHAVHSLMWTATAIAVFQIAIWLQCGLYGFFLPP